MMEAFTAAVEVQLHQVGADGGGQPAIAESFAAAWAAVYSGQQVLLGTEHLLQRVRKEFSSLHLPQFCSGLAACNAREGEDFTQAYAAAAAQLCAVAKLFCHLLRYSSEQALQQPHGLQPEAQIALLNLEMKFRYRIGADVLVATRSTLPGTPSCKHLGMAAGLILLHSNPAFLLAGSLHQFYEAKLNAMAAAMDEEDGSMQELSWASGMQEVAECMQILTLQETTQAEAGAAVAEHLTQHLTECTAQNFDSSVIEAALQYSSSVYPKFLELVYLPKVSNGGRMLRVLALSLANGPAFNLPSSPNHGRRTALQRCWSSGSSGSGDSCGSAWAACASKTCLTLWWTTLTASLH